MQPPPPPTATPLLAKCAPNARSICKIITVHLLAKKCQIEPVPVQHSSTSRPSYYFGIVPLASLSLSLSLSLLVPEIVNCQIQFFDWPIFSTATTLLSKGALSVLGREEKSVPDTNLSFDEARKEGDRPKSWRGDGGQM